MMNQLPQSEVENVAVGIAAPMPPRPNVTVGSDLRNLWRFIYNHNPFYVISALLVFSGLWQSFTERPELVEAGVIALGLGAYALLLALTAVLIIRLGHVWEDVRSLLLLVVLMFLAISVSSDPVLNAEEQPGRWFVLAGFLFSVALSEAVLRSLPLVLPMMYRLPYYLILALFFLYPLAMSPVLNRPPAPPLYWALFGFSAVACAAFLTLLPAVWRGVASVRASNCPWRWPVYPWVLFGMLAICVCLRAWYLCMSFHAIEGTSCIFGAYFLAPFLFAINVLLIEASIVSGGARLRRVALSWPLFILVVCGSGHRLQAVYLEFLERFADVFHGSPLYVALMATVGLYLYALARRVPGAITGLSLAIGALAFVSPRATLLEDIMYYRAWPIVLAATIQFLLAARAGSSLRAVSAAGAALWAIQCAPGWESLGIVRTALVWHAGIALVLAIGATFRDDFVPTIRALAAGLLIGSTLIVADTDPRQVAGLPPAVVEAYPVVPLVVALAYARLVGGMMFYGVAAACAAGWLVVIGSALYRQLRAFVPGLDKIAWGIAFFALATIVSLAKAGLWRRLKRAVRSSVVS